MYTYIQTICKHWQNEIGEINSNYRVYGCGYKAEIKGLKLNFFYTTELIFSLRLIFEPNYFLFTKSDSYVYDGTRKYFRYFLLSHISCKKGIKCQYMDPLLCCLFSVVANVIIKSKGKNFALLCHCYSQESKRALG